MSLLNDFAVTSSSKDQVVIQKSPVSLDIWKVGTVALVMAVRLMSDGFISYLRIKFLTVSSFFTGHWQSTNLGLDPKYNKL